MFKLKARTILELGLELISSDIIAFYELVKNGFDARTKNGVEIRFEVVLGFRAYRELIWKLNKSELKFQIGIDNARAALHTDAGPIYETASEHLDGVKNIRDLKIALDRIYGLNTITISDTGSGMSMDELESVFLVIGTESRKKEIDAAIANNKKSAPYFGEKGIGRLSAMRLGNRMKVRTTRTDDEYWNYLDVNWSDFDVLDAMLNEISVEPKRGEKKGDRKQSGTDITVGNLISDWTRKRLEVMAREEFSLLSAPLSNQIRRKRIALFWNGDRIAIPTLDKSFLSHAHSIVKGEYKIGSSGPQLSCRFEIVALGFDHPRQIEILELSKNELVSALVGEHSGLDITSLESVGPFSFAAYWFNRQRLRSIDGIGDRATVRKLHAFWSGIRLYRDGFRVHPYGAEDDDWLSLDRRALMSRGYTLNKAQFIGQVNIGRMTNPKLIDQTNREGLCETPEQRVLLETLRFIVQDQLRATMLRVERQYKKTRTDITSVNDETRSLERRARTAIKELRKKVPKIEWATIDDLQETLYKLSEIASTARDRIEEVESDAQNMIQMAGIGLLVEVVAHELARVSEHALENLNSLRRKSVPAEVRSRLESLRSSMKSINKRLRVLDPLSVSGRQRAEKFVVNELLTDTFNAHEAQFDRHSIKLNLYLPDSRVHVRAVKGMVVQVIENLLSNSIYWVRLEKRTKQWFKPELNVWLIDNPVTVVFEDNGPGISPGYAESIFELFFSLKEKNQRRGMGLYIARECAEFNGGSLTLDFENKNANERFNRFVYVLADKNEYGN